MKKYLALLMAAAFLAAAPLWAADQRILATEEMVGANHATKADTLNRLGLVEHENDGQHTLSGFQGSQFAADAQASDTYAITLDPVPSAYFTGMLVYFTANTANNGAATLNVNALGAKSILKHHDLALETGDIEAGQLVVCLYDGTYFQLASAGGSAVVLKALFDAYSILYADSDNTPAKLTVGASTIVGRYSSGGIVALTATQVRAILNVDSGADVTGSNAPQAHKTSHQNGGSDEISVSGLSGVLGDDQHVIDSEAKAAAVQSGAITDGVTLAPTHDAVYDVKATADAAQTAAEVAALILAHKNITDAHHAKYLDSEAKAAAVQSGAIANGVTKAPTHDAVYDVKVTADAAQTAPEVLAVSINNVKEDTTPELGGEMDCGAHSVGFTQQAATGDGTTTIDWKLGNKFAFTFGNQADTFTFTAPTKSCNLVLVVKQYSTGGQTATWPGTVKWPDGTAPTLSTGNNAVDIICFYYDGTNYYGSASLDFS